MPDVYSTIAGADLATQERLAQVIELRAADPKYHDLVLSYLGDIEFPTDARVLEVGCGTGAVVRIIACLPGVAHVTGVDPSPVFVVRARELAGDNPNVLFEEADGRSLPFPDSSFDVVVFHTTLTHLPEPGQALVESYRVLRATGTLAVFDGDYSTITESVGPFDPLQTCIDAFKTSFINDVWLIRRLPSILRTTGFTVVSARSHGYLQIDRPDYLLSLIDRGADSMAASGVIGSELAEALKDEARRRSDLGSFYGFINYTSILARKPA